MSDPSYAPETYLNQPQTASTPTPSPTDPHSNLLSNILAGGYSGVNNFAFGLPDLAVKAFGGENYKKLKDWEAQNPVGSTIGGLAGDVGSLFIPGGAIAKAAGKGAQALGAARAASSLERLSNIAKGGEGISKFATGAAQAAEQAIPRAVISSVTNPQDTSSNLTGAGAATLLGGGVGATLGKASGLLKNIKQGFGHQMTDQYLSGFGVSGNDIATHLSSQGGGVGHVVKEIEPAKLDLAQYAKENGIRDDETLKSYLAKADRELKPVADNWDQSPPPTTTIWQRFLRDPRNAELFNSGRITPDAFAAALKDIADPANPAVMGKYYMVNNALDKNYVYAQKHLEASAAGGIEPQQDAEDLLNMYGGLRRAVRDEAFANAPDAAQKIRENWMNHQILRDASIKNSSTLQGTSTGANAGGLSGLSNPALGRATLGALAGGTAGMTVAPQDNKMLGGAIGAGLGAFAPNAIPKAINSLATKLSGHLIPAGEGAAFTGDVPGAAGRLSAIMGKSPAAIGIAPSQISPAPPVQPPQQASAQSVQGLPIGVHASSAPVSMGGESVQPHGQVNLPGGIEGGAGQRVMDNLSRIYNLYHPTDNGRALSKQEFMDQVMQMTNGLDPTNQMTINVLSNSPQERAELSSSIPRLKALTDPSRINLDKLVDMVANVNPADVSAQRTNNNFVTMLAELNNKDPNKQPSPKDIQLAQDTVNKIRNDYTLSPAQKKRQIIDLLVQRGFPLAKMQSLGLTAGTQLDGL